MTMFKARKRKPKTIIIDFPKPKGDKHKWNRAIHLPLEVQYREVDPSGEIIHTKEGEYLAIHDEDFIILGIDGELYPIKKTIFAKVYRKLIPLD